MEEPNLYIENTLREKNFREYENIKLRAINARNSTDVISLSCDDFKL